MGVSGNGGFTWQALQLWGQALHSPAGQGGHGPWGGVKGGSAQAPLGQLGTLCSLLVPNNTQLPYADDVEEMKQGKPMPCYLQEEGAGGGGGGGGGFGLGVGNKINI